MGFFKNLFGGNSSQTQSYQIGDRVSFKEDGPMTGKQADTGYHTPVILEQKGREGTITKFNEKGFPFVKWDGGPYKVFQGMDIATSKIWYDGTVDLDAFITGIHPDYIEPVTAPKKGKSKSKYTHVDISKSDPSTFECEKCRKTNSHQRISDQYAGDLWLCPSCGYKSYRSKGL